MCCRDEVRETRTKDGRQTDRCYYLVIYSHLELDHVTCHIPTLEHLLIFGSKITAKKAKKCTMALDPNVFDGIFLGYRSMMDNLII